MFRKGIGGAMVFDGIKHHRPLETALGVGIMLSGGGSSHHHKSRHTHRTYHHVETAAEKEARLAREETQRRQREEEQRRAMEIARQEEIQRIQHYDEHVALLMRASELKSDELIKSIESLKPLKEPGYYYSHSDKKGMPESKEGNLFSAILARDLPNEITLQAMQLLLERGYPQTALMQEPLLSKFITLNTSFDKLICESYIDYIKHHDGFNKNVELQIWNRLAKSKSNYPELIFETLDSWKRNSLSSLEFATVWLNALDSSKDVVAITKFLEQKFEYRDDTLSHIRKVADQRVLALELEKSTVVQESGNVKSTQDPAIVSFLYSHRTSCCFCSKTEAEKIYEKIVTKKRDEASRELAEQQKKTAENFKQFNR